MCSAARSKLEKSRYLSVQVFYLLTWMVLWELPCSAASTSPASPLAALKADSEKARTLKPGSDEQRRACKRVVRAGTAFIRTHPDAPNRFQLLGVMLLNQKVVVKLEPNDRNRKVLYDICAKLTQAPDTAAKVRLEADVLLSERDLSTRGASIAEREDALKALINRYRGTRAEPKSLMIAAVIANKLGSQDLRSFIEQTMDERCGDNPEMIAFRRRVLSLKSMVVQYHGTFKRSDGAELYFPNDRMGHQYLLVYWSKQNPASERFMREVKAQQDKCPGEFEVYSFNLDDLPDAGEQALREMGLDWQAMYLPGGKRNIFYQAYGATHPVALFVNGFGFTVLYPFGVSPDSQGWRGKNSGVFTISESRLSLPRYLAQLQSLFIGDFLITDATAPFDPNSPPELKMVAPQKPLTPTDTPRGADIPGELLRDIQSCFINPPFRYRLSEKEALAHYQRAEKLCAKAIKTYPTASNLWIARNRRIIALLGMWNLTCHPKYLEQAVTEAKMSLATTLPPGAEVVPKFCLAKRALRTDAPPAAKILTQLVTPVTGGTPQPSALAAAAILAVAANNRDLHEQFRDQLLNAPNTLSPALWNFVAFLRNRYHRFFLLRPNSTRGPRLTGSRTYIVNHGGNPSTEQLPEMTLKNLDGSDLHLPSKDTDKLTLLLFVEPPTDPKADFPVVLDRNGKPSRNDTIRHVVSYAEEVADKDITKSVQVVLAFLADDTTHVADLMRKNNWSGKPVIVPDGLKNSLVQRLGIYSADKVPNVFLLRRDGTIAWHVSGLRYKSEFGYPFALLLGMKVHIEACEVEHGYQALIKGDYQQAVKTFSGPFRPWDPDRYGWRPVRYHGLALARMRLKNWEAALAAVNVAIDAHKRCHYRYNTYKGRLPRASEWRPGMAEIEIDKSCDVFSELWTLKAAILKNLGRTEEANRFQKRVSEPFAPDDPSIYHAYHQKFKAYKSRD